MNLKVLLPLALLAGACAAGCSQESPGTVRFLGNVEKAAAFAAAKDVMSQYYPIAQADPDLGIIKCVPSDAKGPGERLLGASPMRHQAQLELIRSQGGMSARVAVIVQRQGGSIHRAAATSDSYSGVNNQSPADMDAATTTEQNESWQTTGYSYETQRKILEDLYQRLHPEVLNKAPESQPAPE